ncbi:MAG: hypothetical protein CMN32_16410 [Saprospirales bacterium]|nr:hypothetical protein [Saprospirales bacterium]
MTKNNRTSLLVLAAFATIYIVWGSTYLANWYAIHEIPPFLMSGSRFVMAGILLLIASLAIEKQLPTAAQLKNAAWVGFLLLTAGTGMLVWSEQFISSGMVALMTALQPLLVVLLMWMMKGKRPSLQTMLGTGLGMLGMVFLVGQDQFVSDARSLIGIGAIFLALLSWGYASIKVAELDLPKSKLLSAGLQMLFGGLVLVLISVVSGEAGSFDVSAMTARGFWSWMYLIVFGSILAFSAFNYLLVKSTPEKVATANYVNPVVALLLGWGLNNELITNQSLVAAAFMLTGVVFINARIKRRKYAIESPHPLASLVCELDGATTELHILPEGQEQVVARIWEGKAHKSQTRPYLEYLKESLVPQFRGVPGNLGLTLAHKEDGDHNRIYFVSYWKDFDAVKQYAGNDYHRAIIFPKEKEYLSEFQQEVQHRCIKA